MRNSFAFFFGLILMYGCTFNSQKEENNQPSEETWVFFLAGQSNMAGRGQVESVDTITNSRIITLNRENQWIKAREPLHYYEPERTGLDCGMSFAKEMIASLPQHVNIAVIPCAVGGSSVEQWLGDSLHRNVNLLTNFNTKLEIAREKGMVKGILWHQGESNAHDALLPSYQDRLTELFRIFRAKAGNDNLPIIIGELGNFDRSEPEIERFKAVNRIMHFMARQDPYLAVIKTGDLDDKGDELHFNSDALRSMGQRYANTYKNNFMMTHTEISNEN